MIALVLVIVSALVLVARTRFWWLPGTAVATCSIPVLGFFLGGMREDAGELVSALLYGGLVAGLGLALCAVAGLMNHLFQRRDTVVLSRRGGATSSQLL